MTRRESQTLPLIRQGCSNKEIASELSRSVKAIEWRVHSLCEKYGARNRTHLVAILAAMEDPRDYL